MGIITASTLSAQAERSPVFWTCDQEGNVLGKSDNGSEVSLRVDIPDGDALCATFASAESGGVRLFVVTKDDPSPRVAVLREFEIPPGANTAELVGQKRLDLVAEDRMPLALAVMQEPEGESLLMLTDGDNQTLLHQYSLNAASGLIPRRAAVRIGAIGNTFHARAGLAIWNSNGENYVIAARKESAFANIYPLSWDAPPARLAFFPIHQSVNQEGSVAIAEGNCYILEKGAAAASLWSIDLADVVNAAAEGGEHSIRPTLMQTNFGAVGNTIGFFVQEQQP